ncbi:MAG: 3-oxoadipate enol-lactonase [Kiloniellales bacterium]
MNAIERDGVAIRYQIEGQSGGPALVFSNSLGTDVQVWDAILPAFAGRFRLLRYDKRGHGLSDAPPAPYAIYDHVADLAAVADAAGIKRAIVVGLSVGGLIAQGLAQRRPDLVGALVLCDTGHKIGTADMWNGRIETIRMSGIATLAEPILERWFSADFRKNRKGELAVWRNLLIRTPVEGYLGTAAAIRDADMTEAARAIRVPTLCIGGSQDGATPPALMREMTALIPGARLELIEGAGHLPCIESPDAVVAEMTGFFKEIGYG